MDLRKYLVQAGSAIATVIITYASLMEIAKSYGVALTLPINYLLVLAFLGLTAFPLWVGYQIGTWRSQKSVSADIEPQLRPVPAIMQPKLDELEKGLVEVILEPPSTFSTSGDTYVDKTPFRQRVNKYILLEAEAENLLGVRHESFYVNPDLFEASQSNSAHLTDLASNLLQKVKESRATIQTYEDAIAQAGTITHYPIIGTRRGYHRSTIYDQTRDYLQAYLFYPFWYFIPLLSKLMGKHRDLWNYPREMIIVNTTTEKAYPLRGLDAETLIYPIVRIGCNPEFEPFPYSHLDRWCLKRGWELIDKTPTPADLQRATT